MSEISQIKKIESRLRLIKLLNMVIAAAMLVVLVLSLVYFALNFRLDFIELHSLSMRMAALTSLILGLIFLQDKVSDNFVNFYKDFADTYGIQNRQARATKNIVRLYRSFLKSGGPFFQDRELHTGIFSLSVVAASFFLISSGALWLWIRYALTF